MKMVRITFLVLMNLFLIIGLIGSVYAITGSIGNARMVLRAKTGDTIEKTILVRNINDQAVDIDLFASGDLGNYTKLIDKKFTLQSGEEKNARFQIKVAKEGTTDTKINVKFTPTIGKEGIGLTSTVIIIAEKGNGILDFGNEDETDVGEENNTAIPITGNIIKNASLPVIAVIITVVMLFVFIGLLIFSKKNSDRGLEKNIEETKPKKVNLNE